MNTEGIQEEIDKGGEATGEQIRHFHEYCKAQGKKIDRIGRFLQMLEARILYCRGEANLGNVRPLEAFALFRSESGSMPKWRGRLNPEA